MASWSWSRWNDSYGLNVAGMVESYPGWIYSFDRQTRTVSAGDGPESEVEVFLKPVPMDKRHPPATSRQHIYGYWAHPTLRAKPNWVRVRCGGRVLERVNTRPWDSFHRDLPEPPSTFPPPPPRPGGN